ncbi:MAG: hypothetical protein ABG776_06470 [Cyanobacteria bacterium J06555_13]
MKPVVGAISLTTGPSDGSTFLTFMMTFVHHYDLSRNSHINRRISNAIASIPL